MIKIISLFLFLFSYKAIAESEYIASIEKIDSGTNEHPHLLLLNDGYVLKINSKRKDDLQYFQHAIEQKKVLKFSINENREVLQFMDLGELKIPQDFTDTDASVPYTPTVLNSISEAQTIFENFRKGATNRSQCYNRAHIWSYESKSKYDLNSMKVFVFYTRKYIREYDFDWWFHVSPFTYIRSGDQNIESVLDYKFSKGPLPMKDWTDIFMTNRSTCPVITKYSQYENHQEESYCYLFKASMYYLQPLDLDNLERYEREKFDWIQYEVKRAYRNGFNFW